MVPIDLPEGAMEAYTLKITREDTGENVYEVTVPVDKTKIEIPLTGTGTVTYVVSVGGEAYSTITVDFDVP